MVNAYTFAVLEHRFSRILFFSLLATYVIFYYINDMKLTDIMLKIDIGLWLAYWISHNLEKWMFKMTKQGRK